MKTIVNKFHRDLSLDRDLSLWRMYTDECIKRGYKITECTWREITRTKNGYQNLTIDGNEWRNEKTGALYYDVAVAYNVDRSLLFGYSLQFMESTPAPVSLGGQSLELRMLNDAIAWRMAHPDEAIARIGRRFGISNQQLTAALRDRGIELSNRSGKVQDAVAWRMAHPEATHAEAARLFGVSAQSVSQEIAALGGAPAKNSAVDQAVSWRMAHPEATHAEAARLFGVSIASVSIKIAALGGAPAKPAPYDPLQDARTMLAQWVGAHPLDPLAVDTLALLAKVAP